MVMGSPAVISGYLGRLASEEKLDGVQRRPGGTFVAERGPAGRRGVARHRGAEERAGGCVGMCVRPYPKESGLGVGPEPRRAGSDRAYDAKWRRGGMRRCVVDLAVSSRHSAQPIAGWVLQQSRVIAAQAAASSQWPYRLAWLAAVLSSLDAPRNSSRPCSDWRESERVRPIMFFPSCSTDLQAQACFPRVSTGTFAPFEKSSFPLVHPRRPCKGRFASLHPGSPHLLQNHCSICARQARAPPAC